jgi:tryptophan synthase alpha chain
MGVERFADAATESGVLGAIVPDIPLEETGDLRAALEGRGLALPLLVAPTTPPARARAIARASRGFLYVVSRMGVTGARRRPDFAATAERVSGLRGYTGLPLAVGFGIATPEDIATVAAFADGAIVGSALIDAYAGRSGREAAAKAGALAASLVEAARAVPASN